MCRHACFLLFSTACAFAIQSRGACVQRRRCRESAAWFDEICSLNVSNSSATCRGGVLPLSTRLRGGERKKKFSHIFFFLLGLLWGACRQSYTPFVGGRGGDSRCSSRDYDTVADATVRHTQWMLCSGVTIQLFHGKFAVRLFLAYFCFCSIRSRRARHAQLLRS